MSEYHKITTLFERDPTTNHRYLIEGRYAKPEFGYLAECPWTWSEKVDGTNIRVNIASDGTAQFAGRTDAAQLPGPLVSTLRSQFSNTTILSLTFPSGATLYGEGCGPGIQKGGGNYSPSQVFVLFDIRVGSLWLSREAVQDVAGKLGLLVVPEIGVGTLPELVRVVKRGFESTWGHFQAEGVVARPVIELYDRRGSRVITKLKYKDWPR